MLFSLSAFWARIELGCAALMALGVTLLILLNVITRNLGAALFWVDELAIYAMIWMAFLGASAGFHYRSAVSITLLTDALPPRAGVWASKGVDLLSLCFALFVLWFCWQWFSPVQLAQTGFDTAAFQSATFNFIYAEVSPTLNVPKFFFWLVMWLFALGATLHCLAHLFARPNREIPQ